MMMEKQQNQQGQGHNKPATDEEPLRMQGFGDFTANLNGDSARLIFTPQTDIVYVETLALDFKQC